MVSHVVRSAQKASNQEEQKLHGGYFYRNATFVDVGSSPQGPWEAFQGFILNVHVEDDVIRRRYDRIFDIHFRLRDTADFVPPYITMGNPQ